MNKNTDSFLLLKRSTIFLLVIGLCLPCSSRADSLSVQAARKIILSQQIDSLEVEKQVKKRNGQPFEDLEEKTVQLRDSLALLKEVLLKNAARPAPAQPLSRESAVLSFVKHFRPHSDRLFDWIIICVGSIAVISGLILVVGIMKAALTKRNYRRRRPAPPEIAPEDITPDTPVGEVLAGNNLRETPEEGGGIEERVLSAAKDGLDIQAISRRLHVGTDQVALILRAAGRK